MNALVDTGIHLDRRSPHLLLDNSAGPPCRYPIWLAEHVLRKLQQSPAANIEVNVDLSRSAHQSRLLAHLSMTITFLSR